MGYPLRWDQIADPQPLEAATVNIGKESAPKNRHEDGFQSYFRRLATMTLVASVAIVFSVVGITSYILHDRSMPALSPDSLPAGAVVAALSPHIVRKLGFVVVTGSLVNRSAKSLQRVEAVVDLLGADRHTLKSQSALVDLDSVAPGRSSAFRLAMADSSSATAYRLRFRNLNGTDLN